MRNLAIWIAGVIVVLVIAHFTPKQEHDWLIIETGAFLFWLCVGGLLFGRFIYRFIVKA